LQSLPVPSDCWRSVSMDFFFGLPKNGDGHNGVLVFVDRLSKMVHLAPVSDTYSGQDCAKVFMDVVFRHHGLPDSIVSDRDPRFTGDFWNGLFLLLGSSLDMSTADHPQTDGQTERANRVAEDILRSYCAENPASWSELLPMVEFAMNNAVHASTGLTPVFVNGLRHPSLPLCLMGGPKTGGEGARLLASQKESILKSTIRQSVDAFWSTRVSVLTRVRDAMADAQDQQKEQAGKHNRGNKSVFKEGDYVLLSTKNLSQDAVSTLGSTKLLPRYIGPFRVLKRKGTAYRLDLPSWLRTHPTFYVGLLKAFHLDDTNEPDSADENAQESAQANRAPTPPDSSTEPSTPLRQATVRREADGGRPRGSRSDLPHDGTSLPTVRRSARQATQLASSCPRPSEALGQPRPDGRPSPRADRVETGTPPRGESHAPRSRRSDHGEEPTVAPAQGGADPTEPSSRPLRHSRRPARGRLPVLDRNGETHYHVEAIVASRQRSGHHEGLVKWLGYPKSQSTWLAWEALREDCPDLVRECERNHTNWFR
jgi:hypothetical protein